MMGRKSKRKKSERKRAVAAASVSSVLAVGGAATARALKARRKPKSKTRPLDVKQVELVAGLERSRKRLKKMISPKDSHQSDRIY